MPFSLIAYDLGLTAKDQRAGEYRGSCEAGAKRIAESLAG